MHVYVCVCDGDVVSVVGVAGGGVEKANVADPAPLRFLIAWFNPIPERCRSGVFSHIACPGISASASKVVLLCSTSRSRAPRHRYTIKMRANGVAAVWSRATKGPESSDTAPRRAAGMNRFRCQKAAAAAAHKKRRAL